MVLQGYKIVELASYIAAPGAAGILADWGAEVTKVEARDGDPIRRLRPGSPGACSPEFESINRGKRDVVLDYGQPQGREALLRLVRQADVFITSMRPGSLARAGLDWAALANENDRLVYASVTGYGLDGPGADLPAFDVTAFWSRSGLAFQTVPEGLAPFAWRPGMGDHSCAVATALGIVTALLDRTRTGKGRLVETSLLRCGVHAIGFDIADQLRLGDVARTAQREAPQAVLSSYFRTADNRWLCIYPLNPTTDWPDIFGAAGRADLASDPRFISPEARTVHRAVLMAALDLGFAEVPLSVIADRLASSRLVWSPVQSPAEVVSDPLAIAAGCFVEVEGRNGAPFRGPAPPVRFPGVPEGVKAPAPNIGEHTDAVLKDLGFSDEQIAEMKRTGAAS